MDRRQVLLVFGTRPEAIKMAPLIAALHASPELEPVVAVTGQHRGMLDQVLDQFGIVPDADLDLHSPGQTLRSITTGVLDGASSLLAEMSPDALVVQGDTTSAFAAGLAAFYAQVPVVHLEAGLRSGNPYAPFPEEINRRLLTQLAALHLAATPANRHRLVAEGVPAGDVVVTGNTVIDALLAVRGRRLPWQDCVLAARVGDVAPSTPLIVVTAHRRESWGAPLRNIAAAVAHIARWRPEVRFVWPLHANPLVRDAVLPVVEDLENVVVTDAVGHADLVRLLSVASVALTDSGGIQEEAPALGVPVLVTRDVTERAEAIACGAARLVGTDRAEITRWLTALLDDPRVRERMTPGFSPYGDGHAARRAAAAIEQLLGVGERLPDYPVPAEGSAAQRSEPEALALQR